ncbi:MAG: Mrp/NBP35 family ATP-binding protein [Candidatus Methanomethylophilaceae archaeon]|jgi:ATP-binding protein involved in chromosome partitioning|nr:Mrp/NBP35 family ATP-binding protein [Candidatus Methanomethylophilaceae archaeon]NCA73367.1 ATP-binding protein [Gammaproteobacteria bacterium]MDD3351018.1 Mrp/NBP35 family ATP-binding protein [Candidatus Methanomethylophilaceae archaeon]MDD3986380.1 Mrp/NBP35 family ATP-binding protein [Candidatus Methanomethylophilaceae archaeon]MDD4708817.1 Mrp/NBP35 family ATP-binding protein [Candidatus Methanomethylophilaceae archaeon]
MAGVISADKIEEDTRLKESLGKIKHVIIVLSGKGGVGKSTVSSNLACALSNMGYETGIMDVDITGPNIPKMFGIEDEKLDVQNNKLVPVIVPPSLKVMSMAFLLPTKDTPVLWRGPVKMTAIRQFIEDVEWGDLDYLVIDMPPGTGDEALSIMQLIPKPDGAVIVTTPQDVSLMDSRKTITFSAEAKIPVIGLVENMSGFICPHCGEETDIFKSGGGETVAKEFGVQFLGKVPIEPSVVLSGDDGMPAVLSEPDSASAQAFGSIIKKIIATVEAK